MCPGFDISDGGGFGDTKIMIRSVADITKLRPAILAAYDGETVRLATGVDAESPEGGGGLC